MKRSIKWIIGIVVVLVIVGAGYFSFGGNKKSTSSQTVTVGIMSGTSKDDKIWNAVAKIAKDKYKVNVKYKKFTDYTQPNKAVANGDVDIDAFQHYDFLADWNKSNKGSIVPIGKTFITPIRVYSKKVKSLNDLKTGATIAVPNDATNESRALFVLKNAGLITFKPGTTQATLSAIAKNPKKIKIKELDASQTARALSDVDAAVINTNFAQTAGLNYKSAIYVEPINKDSEKWINIVAAEKKDKNKKAYKDYVKAFQTKKIKNLINKEYGQAEIAAWDLKIK
ncbi:MetQ/NlpA family ABC transporter substrate-binding protein [Lentilactobacillus diolivorans]|uniref:MetQ/NlpA family ABC transporter substrate-binding protein n=1 Tax=Lentilactobacillus diolivorans TaxID=179838 RepID=UPI0024687EF3|nr:MetQ/NlpA family ABC transporter substrate-binding protein [Lentilactobacillus diolivorans]MDH5106836.1 MetQ/NlpA family ABC transporter substrate-binding protein [Lentilactobacillus diolivorans]